MGDLPRYRERDSRFLRNLTGQHPNETTHSHGARQGNTESGTVGSHGTRQGNTLTGPHISKVSDRATPRTGPHISHEYLTGQRLITTHPEKK